VPPIHRRISARHCRVRAGGKFVGAVTDRVLPESRHVPKCRLRQRIIGGERQPRDEVDDRRLEPGAELDDLLHFLGRFGEHHGVGQMRLVEGDILAVLLAHGVRRAHPLAVELPKLGDGGVDLRGSCLNLACHFNVPGC